jgi:hypothetical protein
MLFTLVFNAFFRFDLKTTEEQKRENMAMLQQRGQLVLISFVDNNEVDFSSIILKIRT